MSPERLTPLDSVALAGESHKGADDAAGLATRLDRYSRAHHRALDMADYAKKHNHVKEAQGLSKCGHYLLFRDYYKIGKVRLKAADFCRRHLLCPLCAIRRGAKLVQAYQERLQVVQEKQSGLQAYLVTLTVKNGEDLAERFEHIRSSMNRMTQARRDYLKGGKHAGPHIEMAKAVGYVGSFEFKRGAGSGEWHPHAHMVWLCREAPDAAKLSREWLNLTGDSFIVDVRPFHNQEDITSGFLEVFKYAVKFSDLPLEDNWHGYEVLKARRLIFSGGAFYGIELPDRLEDEPLDDQPFIELLYRFARGAGYELISTSEPRQSDKARAQKELEHEEEELGAGQGQARKPQRSGAEAFIGEHRTGEHLAERTLDANQATHAPGTWGGVGFLTPPQMPHGECGVWGRAPEGTSQSP